MCMMCAETVCVGVAAATGGGWFIARRFIHWLRTNWR